MKKPQARIDIGSRYGKLVVLQEKNHTHGSKFLCRCDCGAELWVTGYAIRNYKRNCGSSTCSSRKGPNEIIDRGDYCEIILSNGKKALVDAEDREAITGKRWRQKANGGAVTEAVSRGALRLSRVVLRVTDPTVEVDHIDGDNLNNRKSNLRACSHALNLRNIHKRRSVGGSRFKGVTKTRNGKRFRAYIVKDYKQRNLGVYDSEVTAALAYNDAARELFGEFAWLNEVPTGDFVDGD